MARTKISFGCKCKYAFTYCLVPCSLGLLDVDSAQAQFSGAVYVQTNELDGNAVAAFGRNSDGTLSFIDNFATGGLGSTEFDGGEGLDPLISADSIITTDDQRFLLTVNAGSDTITSFCDQQQLFTYASEHGSVWRCRS